MHKKIFAHFLILGKLPLLAPLLTDGRWRGWRPNCGRLDGCYLRRGAGGCGMPLLSRCRSALCSVHSDLLLEAGAQFAPNRRFKFDAKRLLDLLFKFLSQFESNRGPQLLSKLNAHLPLENLPIKPRIRPSLLRILLLPPSAPSPAPFSPF